MDAFFKESFSSIDVYMIPCLWKSYKDYSYFVKKRDSKKGFLIDPAERRPIEKFFLETNFEFQEIFCTHHHHDHTNELAFWKNKSSLKKVTCSKFNKDSAQIADANYSVEPDGVIELGSISFQIIGLDGHTKGQIGLYSKDEGILFCGDALFSLGCGRVLDNGSLEELFQSLGKISKLPEDTQIFCSHEYTLKNLKFCESLSSKVLPAEMVKEASRARTVPCALGFELKYSPFLKLASVGDQVSFQEFTHLRALRDSF